MGSAIVTGSGTASMARFQLFRVVTPPGEVSAKNSVQVLFGFWPAKVVVTSIV